MSSRSQAFTPFQRPAPTTIPTESSTITPSPSSPSPSVIGDVVTAVSNVAKTTASKDSISQGFVERPGAIYIPQRKREATRNFAPPPESSPASISNVNHSSPNALIPATSATDVAASSITSHDSNKNSLGSWLTWLIGLDPTSSTLSSRLLRGGIFLLLSYCIYKLYQYYQQWKLKIQLIKETIEKKKQEELNMHKQRQVMLQQYQHVQEQVKTRFDKMQLFMQNTFHLSNKKEQQSKDESVTTTTTTTTTTTNTTTITSHSTSSTPSSNSPNPSAKLLDMVSQSFDNCERIMAENIYLRDLLQRAQTELKIKEDELKLMKKSTDMKRSSAANQFAMFSSSSTLLSSIPSDSVTSTSSSSSSSSSAAAYPQSSDGHNHRNNSNQPTPASTSASRVVF